MDKLISLHRIGLAWAVVASGLTFVLIWLDPVAMARLGGLWLTIVILLGGIAVHLDQSYHSKLTACSVKPQIHPLQVSCLAVQALGVQWLWYAASPDFVAVIPFLAWSGWPYLCIVSGVAGLGWLSLSCDCRNETLRSFEP
ncbi:MAG: hypothetical protein HS126_36725 [Anaerolineales bacterium]|nr:hypothetical protein [Anaerolineales bacterium]